MAQLTIYKNAEEAQLARLKHNLSLTPNERMKLAFNLMALSIKFKKSPLKEPSGNGIILTK